MVSGPVDGAALMVDRRWLIDFWSGGGKPRPDSEDAMLYAID